MHRHTLMSSKGLRRQIVPDPSLSASWALLTPEEMIRGGGDGESWRTSERRTGQRERER